MKKKIIVTGDTSLLAFRAALVGAVAAPAPQPCPPQCAPGIKCDYCSPEANPATAPVSAAQDENPAEPHASRAFFTLTEAAESFTASLLDEADCRGWILRRIHPWGARCPYCKAEAADEPMHHNFYTDKRCLCKGCGRWYTARTRTILQGAHLEYRQIYLMAVLLSLIPAEHKRIAAIIGISADTVRLWTKRFRAFEG